MSKLFNTPFEFSLHVLLLLDSCKKPISADRILALDFMTVYADSFGIAESSLNGDNSFSFSEITVRRQLIKEAIKDLVIDGLIMVPEECNGMLYRITRTGKDVTSKLNSEYAQAYHEISVAVIQKYQRRNDQTLMKMITTESAKALRR